MGAGTSPGRHASPGRGAVAVRGVDADRFAGVTGGRVRVGTDTSEGTAAVVEEHHGELSLLPEDPADPLLRTLEGPVVLWWPDDRGRWQVEGVLSREGGTASVSLHWPPRHEQQRQFLRARLTTDAWVTRLDDAGIATGTVLDLSAGGVSVVVAEPPEWWRVGTPVAVCVVVDGQGVVAAATVVRVGANFRLAALRFDAVAAADEDRITSAVLAADARRAAR